MLRLFGKPFVELDGKPVEGLPSAAFLIVGLIAIKFGNRASRSDLAATLREDAEPKSANGFLRTQVLRIRTWGERHGVQVFDATETMLVRTAETMKSDLDLFEAVDRIDSTQSLDELLSIYRGDFLAGVDPENSPELEQWLYAQRERRRERFMRLAIEGADRVGGEAAERAMARVRDEGPSTDEVVQARLDQSRRGGLSPRTAAVVVRTEDRARPPVQAVVPAISQLVGIPRVALLQPAAGPHPVTQIQRLLADSIIEDVTLSLCRLRAVATIAPHTTRTFKRSESLESLSAHNLDYVVRSKLMPAQVIGDDITLRVSLRRMRDDEVMWATDLGISRASGPARHAELAGMLAAALVDAVAEAELRPPVATATATAYYNYLLGRRSLRNLDLASIRRARTALRKSKTQATNFAPALSLYARTLSLEWVLLGRTEPDLLVEAERLAKEAIDLDPFDAAGFRELGRAALFLYGPAASLEHFFAAERLAPHHADILADSADTLVHNSDIDRAHERMELALNLNPIPPDEYRWTAGGIRFYRGDYEQGLQILRAMRQPEPASRLMAACAAMAGDRGAAEKYRLQALSLHPDFTIEEWMRVMPQRAKEHQEKYVQALRLAGFK